MAKNKKRQGNFMQKISLEKYIAGKARLLPLGKTYICRKAASQGTYVAIVTRQHAGGRLTAGIYLIDTYCLGVKDTFFLFSMEPEDMEERISDMGMEFEETEYAEVHNLIYGALEYAEEAGIDPNPGFKVTEYILEPDDDAIPLQEFDFGHHGVRELVVGPDYREMKFIPTLERNVPGEFIVTGYSDRYYDENPDEDFFYEPTTGNTDPDSFNFDFHPFPHDPYPENLEEVRHDELLDIFYPEEGELGDSLDASQIATIRAIPREELVTDLRVIVGYELGQTETEIADYGEYNSGEFNVLYHIWAILAEIGGPDTADIVRSVMQQSYHMFDAYLGDYGLELSHSVLAGAFGDNPEQLAEMTLAQGYSVYSRVMMLYSLECIAGWIRGMRGRVEKALHDMAELVMHYDTAELPLLNDYFMGTLSAVMVGLNMKADLPLIKEMHDKGLVDQRVYGDYDEQLSEIAYNEEHGYYQETRFTNLEEIYRQFR